MNRTEFASKFEALPPLSKTIMGLYAEPGFSDVDASDLSCTSKQWSGVSKRLIEDDLIFIDRTDINNTPMEFIQCPVHSDENDGNGDWEIIQKQMAAYLCGHRDLSVADFMNGWRSVDAPVPALNMTNPGEDYNYLLLAVPQYHKHPVMGYYQRHGWFIMGSPSDFTRYMVAWQPLPAMPINKEKDNA